MCDCSNNHCFTLAGCFDEHRNIVSVNKQKRVLRTLHKTEWCAYFSPNTSNSQLLSFLRKVHRPRYTLDKRVRNTFKHFSTKRTQIPAKKSKDLSQTEPGQELDEEKKEQFTPKMKALSSFIIHHLYGFLSSFTKGDVQQIVPDALYHSMKVELQKVQKRYKSVIKVHLKNHYQSTFDKKIIIIHNINNYI